MLVRGRSETPGQFCWSVFVRPRPDSNIKKKDFPAWETRIPILAVEPWGFIFILTLQHTIYPLLSQPSINIPTASPRQACICFLMMISTWLCSQLCPPFLFVSSSSCVFPLWFPWWLLADISPCQLRQSTQLSIIQRRWPQKSMFCHKRGTHLWSQIYSNKLIFVLMFLNLGNSIKLEVFEESVTRVITQHSLFSSHSYMEKSEMMV